jgi:hypothetical protein
LPVYAAGEIPKGGIDVPKHSHAVQFRPPGHRGGDQGIGVTIRSQAERVRAPLEGQRGSIPAGGRGCFRRCPPSAACAGNHEPTAQPRGGSSEGARTGARAIWLTTDARLRISPPHRTSRCRCSVAMPDAGGTAPMASTCPFPGRSEHWVRKNSNFKNVDHLPADVVRRLVPARSSWRTAVASSPWAPSAGNQRESQLQSSGFHPITLRRPRLDAASRQRRHVGGVAWEARSCLRAARSWSSRTSR